VLSRLLGEGHLPSAWVATVIDRDGIIVARTRGIEQLLGKAATPEFVAQSRRDWDGSFREVTQEGVSVYGAYSRSRLSGWTVGLGVPVAAVDRAAHIALFTILGGGAVLLLSAGGLSIVLGRRIATAIGSLSSSARALGRGETPPVVGRATISEVGNLEAEMVVAAHERAEVVAARAKAEEALQESEERMRLIVSHALDAVITADAHGRITSWNPQAEALFGWSRDEALGRALSETIVPPAYREAHERGLAHFLATGEGPVLGRRLELTALRRNGAEFPIELAITPLRMGSVTVFSAFVRDISQRKDAEEAHRRSEASFRLLFAGNPLPMWVYDTETLYFLEVNDAAVSHYGYTREEFLRMRASDIRPPEEMARFEAKIAEVAAAPQQIMRRSAGWRHRLKDGRIREMDTVAHALEFGGRQARLVVAIDVTDLNQAQEERARTAVRLQILHDIDRGIIGAEAPAAIAEAVLGPLRELLGVPRVIVNLFDHEAGEVEWLAAAGRRRMHVGPGVRFSLELMGDVVGLRRGEVQVVSTAALPSSAAKSALLASGVEHYMVVPMIATGELIGAVSFGGAPEQFPPETIGIAQEVATQLAIAVAQARLHERVTQHAAQLEQRVRDRTLELQQHKERLEDEVMERTQQLLQAEKLAAMGNLLAGVAHELNNPLSVILGHASLMHLNAKDTQSRKRGEKITAAAGRCARIVKNFLSLARQRSVEHQRCRLNDIVNEAVELVAYPLRVDNVTVRLALDTNLPDLWADPHQLGQVLVNLITNAHQAMRQTGEPTLTLRSGYADEQGSVFVEVGDSGPGVPPALREKIFEPFFTTKAPGEGTGLGLHLCRTIIQDHAGTLCLVDRPEQGAVFRLQFPVGAVEESTAAPEADLGPIRLTERTILVVDDEPSITEMLVEILSHAGARVEVASNGLEAVKRLESGSSYDAILSDLRMPHLDGPGLYQEVLRSRPELGSRIIFMTGDALSPRVASFLETVSAPRISKPFSPDTILRVVYDAVTSHKGSSS
jgi:PAS domain S-box-containing protein